MFIQFKQVLTFTCLNLGLLNRNKPRLKQVKKKQFFFYKHLKEIFLFFFKKYLKIFV